MKRYTALTFKASWKGLLVFIPLAIGFGLLVHFLEIHVTTGIKFTLFAIKIGILAIVFPYITTSLESFYEDIKLFKPEEYKEVAIYYEPPLIIVFCAAVTTSCSMILDILFFVTCCRGLWDFGLGALASGIVGVITFSFYLLTKGIGEIEALKGAGKNKSLLKSKRENANN